LKKIHTSVKCKSKVGLENKKKQKVDKTTRRHRDLIRLEPPPVEGGAWTGHMRQFPEVLCTKGKSLEHLEASGNGHVCPSQQ
jgi:hypothetical protein